MRPVVSFPLIVGETRAGRISRRLRVMGLLLGIGLLVGRVVPGLVWLLGASLTGYVALVVYGLATARRSQFVLDGQVDFYENELWVRGQPLPLADLRRIEARFTFARGESAGPNGLGDEGNRLLLYLRQPAPPQRLNVLVTSRAQRTVLCSLLLRWRQQGHEVLADVL